MVNPGSGGGRGRRRAARCEALLRAAGLAYEKGETRNLEEARTLARRALDEGRDPLVAVGGDGTINRVVQALAEAREEGTAARLGVLYTGTSPDFCRFHRLPRSPEAAVDRLLHAPARPVDVGRVEGEDRTAHFICSANLGLGAGIARRANRRRPRLGDFLGTLSAALESMARSRPGRVRLRLDGEEITLDRVHNITLGKNPFLASGLKLEAGVTPADGSLYCFALHGVGRLGALLSLPGAYTGRLARDRRFFLRRCVDAAVEPLDRSLAAEFDGDPAGWCPTRITLLPGALSLIGGGG